LTRIRVFFPKTVLIIAQKYEYLWIEDPKSRVRKTLIPFLDPGVKKTPDPGSGSATLFVDVILNYINCVGQPHGGFPEPFRSQVLKDLPRMDGRPGRNCCLVQVTDLNNISYC
jgi:hypothetical protein